MRHVGFLGLPDALILPDSPSVDEVLIDFQEALVHETIIRQLSNPHCLTPQSTVHLHGRRLLLRSYGPAHWAALQYVERLIRHIGFWEDENYEDRRCDAIRSRFGPDHGSLYVCAWNRSLLTAHLLDGVFIKWHPVRFGPGTVQWRVRWSWSA